MTTQILTGLPTERRFSPVANDMLEIVSGMEYRDLPELVQDLDPDLKPELDRLARHVFGMLYGAREAAREGDRLDLSDVAHATALSLLGDGYRQGE